MERILNPRERARRTASTEWHDADHAYRASPRPSRKMAARREEAEAAITTADAVKEEARCFRCGLRLSIGAQDDRHDFATLEVSSSALDFASAPDPEREYYPGPLVAQTPLCMDCFDLWVETVRDAQVIA